MPYFCTLMNFNCFKQMFWFLFVACCQLLNFDSRKNNRTHVLAVHAYSLYAFKFVINSPRKSTRNRGVNAWWGSCHRGLCRTGVLLRGVVGDSAQQTCIWRAARLITYTRTHGHCRHRRHRNVRFQRDLSHRKCVCMQWTQSMKVQIVHNATKRRSWECISPPSKVI